MTSSVRNTVIGCVVFMAIVVGLFTNSMLRPPEVSIDRLRDDFGTLILPQPRELSAFELVAHTGETFTGRDLEGQWTFAYFGFTHCPDICPVTLAVLGQARRALIEAAEEPFDVALFTVDPERDTPEVLEEFVAYFDPAFRGVTGTHGEMARLAQQVSVAFAKVPADEEPDGYVVDHTGNIVIFNPRGHYHGYIRMPHTPERVLAAFRGVKEHF